MTKKELIFSLIILIQACGLIFAQTPAALEASPGVLQRVAEKAREVKAKVQNMGALVLGFADAYYEEHIQPVTDSYVQWASNARSSFWEKIQTSIDNYMPFKSK